MGEVSCFSHWCFAWQACLTCKGKMMSSGKSAGRQNPFLLHANPNPQLAPHEVRCKTNRGVA